jgi:hypothetical protein
MTYDASSHSDLSLDISDCAYLNINAHIHHSTVTVFHPNGAHSFVPLLLAADLLRTFRRANVDGGRNAGMAEGRHDGLNGVVIFDNILCDSSDYRRADVLPVSLVGEREPVLDGTARLDRLLLALFDASNLLR